MTASVTFSPRYASASVFSFCKIIAEISGGLYSLPPMSHFTSLLAPLTTLYVLRRASSSTGSSRPAGSPHFRPMKRLMLYTVFSGVLIACRLAIWPTRRSPFLFIATTDGNNRLPSELVITTGSPPSSTATSLKVVPRSIPTALPILLFLLCVFFLAVAHHDSGGAEKFIV